MDVRRRLAAFALLAAAGASGTCADPPPDAGRSPPAAPPPAPEAARAVQPDEASAGDRRLREDRGGWTPSAELLDAASALGDASRKAEAIAALDAGPLARKIDVLRAGLRLADDAAARACAARLEWRWIDGWECARCVDLLVEDVLRPGTEAKFDEFRSYVGSVDLPRLVRAMPPLPWAHPPREAIGRLHRILRVDHVPLYLELARRPEKEIADAAWADIGLLERWNDEYLLEILGAVLGEVDPADDAGGLPAVVAAYLRRECFDPAQTAESRSRLPQQLRRRLVHMRPGQRDEQLLIEIARTLRAESGDAAIIALLLLGKLHGEASDTFLRELVRDEDEAWAWRALARRRDEAAIEHLAAEIEADPFWEDELALLMEAAPARARRAVETVLLGEDDARAGRMLKAFSEFAPPGSADDVYGCEWRRTPLAGFAEQAVAAGVPALRLARIGTVVPGCRTRAAAEAAASRLRPGDLVLDKESWFYSGDRDETAVFLEVAAPENFRAALGRVADGEEADASFALETLFEMGDPEWGPRFLAEIEDPDLVVLARSAGPDVVALLEHRVRTRTHEHSSGRTLGAAVAALALVHGLPEPAAWVLYDDELPDAAVEAVLAGRPIEAVVVKVEAAPDERHGDVGAVDDPRIRAYLENLRSRRHLDAYWYATAQLTALGDPAARAEYWQAMRDGRYRIHDELGEFERTPGVDPFPALPFWIDELRSQCCRIVTSGAGCIVDDHLGIDGYDTSGRTPYVRATELWESAGGRFVFSRIAGHWVPEPR